MSHPPPPAQKKGFLHTGCFTKNLYFILFESTCPLGQPFFATGPHFVPLGPHRASFGAQFCLFGPRRQPHSASQGILGPLRASSGLVAPCKGTFFFISINYQPCRMSISPQKKVFLPELHFFFNYHPCPGIPESGVLNQKRTLNH